MDLQRESDIQQLRRVAIAQQIQIEQLLGMLRAKCNELAVLKGSEGELQQTLSLVEDLSKLAQAAAERIERLPGTPADIGKSRKRVRASVRPRNPISASWSRPSSSEMIDVVEVILGAVSVAASLLAMRR
jgi:hypothetical protein